MLKKLLIATLVFLSFAGSCSAYYAVRYREHVSDCTGLTDGKAYDYCFEIDSNDVYKCVPSAGDCDTAAEWERIGDYATVQLHIIDYATTVTTGDGKLYFYVPARLNGMNLATIHGQHITAGTSNATTIQLARCAVAASGNACSSTVSDMLSTRLTIDSGEASSHTAAAAAVINTTYDDVATNQVLRVDIDVASTSSRGLIVTLTFIRP